jgi:hypothetical protein
MTNSELRKAIKDKAFLSLFELHLLRIKPYVTREAVLARMKKKECIFSGLLHHFRGDTWFREMRKYFGEHLKERELVRSVFSIINKVFEERRF